MSNVTISQAEYARLKAQAELLEKLKLEKEAWARSKAKLEQEKASLENDVQFLKEQLGLLRKSLYAPKSERAQYLNQIKLDDLFDEIELFSDLDLEELQLLREEGKSPQSRSYMWLYRTGGRSPRLLWSTNTNVTGVTNGPKNF